MKQCSGCCWKGKPLVIPGSYCGTWLVTHMECELYTTIQEFDDPNTTISNILDRLRKFGVTIDFAPSKLKQGFGEQVKETSILLSFKIVKYYKILHAFLAIVPKVRGSFTIPAALKDDLIWTLFHQAESFGLVVRISGRS